MKNIDNILLIGLMGSGKSTIGKMLGKMLDREFVDTDLEIQKKTGVKISTIFELEGEEGFRARETNLLYELLTERNKIFATGGGIILLDANRKILKEIGKIIYLKACPIDLAKRLKYDKSRPLLQNVNLLTKLNSLFEERNFLYESIANFIIDTKGKKVTDITKEILELLKINEKN